MRQQHKVHFGLRPQHYPKWQQQAALPEFFEVLVDNYLFHEGGPALEHLQWFAERSRLLFHGVGLNLGGDDPLSSAYLRALVELVVRFQPDVVSDHLCFTRSGVHESYDLLPLPLNKASLDSVCERVDEVQQVLGRNIALENVSRYVDYVTSTMTELAFLDELCARTGCRVVLDANNLFVNAQNFGFDPYAALEDLGRDRVVQYHVAGHSRVDDFLHDTHDQPVEPEVWQLLCRAQCRFGNHPIVLEHDDDTAPLEVLLKEAALGEVMLNGRARQSVAVEHRHEV